MAYSFTARKHLAYPNASAMVSALPQDLRELGLAEEAVNEGHQDFMGPGIVNQNDWNITPAIDGVTGEVYSNSTFGGPVWTPDPILAGAIMRSVRAPATMGRLVPPSLPATGKYMPAAIEAKGTTWGGDVTLSVKCGSEKATEAEAFASMPARDSDKAQVFFFVIQKPSTYAAVWKELSFRTEAFAEPVSPQSVISPESNVVVPINTEVEPSKVRPTVVELEIATGATPESTTRINISVGGVELWGGNGLRIRQSFQMPVTFVVPAGAKWKWTAILDEGSELPTITATAAYQRL